MQHEQSPTRGISRALIAVGLFLFVLAPGRVASAPATPGPVGGVVYRDSNADGARGAAEVGEPGLTVTAVDASDNRAFTTTGPDGSYSLDLTGFDGGTVRVELGALPDHLEAAPHGPSNRGTVAFVGPGTTVDIGVTNPDEHCQSNPRLVVSCFAMGGNQSETLFSTTSITNAAYNIDADSRTPGNDPKVTTATQQEIGSVGGAAYQRSSRTQFWGAYLKRHAPFGPGGPGAIYRLAPGPDGEAGTADDEPSLYLDINTMFAGNPAGVDPRPPGYTQWMQDPTFAQVGATAWGDLDMSPDGRYLLAVNLGDRHLYRIDTHFDPTRAPTVGDVVRVPVPVPASCPAVDLRPFALGSHDGVSYVGSVCSAESTNRRADLRAYVYEYDASTAAFGSSPVLDESLAFQRGCASRNPITLNCDQPQIDRYWNPWRPAMVPAEWSATNFIVVLAMSRPTPILGDIEFNGDSMVLGFRDRAGDQIGFRTQLSPGSPFLIGTTGGDQLRACRTGGGNWAFESNTSSVGGCATTFGPTNGAGNGQGPGGGEFYYGDSSTSVLDEVSTGMIASIPGTGETAFTTLDPRGIELEGGVRWYSDATGTASKIVSNSTGTPKQVSHQYTVFNADAEIQRFGKANGLGDLEALCDEAPLEIGNRVWFDENRDGRQNPAEPGIPGVLVTLHDESGVLVAGATTDAAGQYWFASVGDPNVGPDPGPEVGLVEFGLHPDTAYRIRFAVSTANLDGITDVAPSALRLSPTDRGDVDAVDSDAESGPGYDEIRLTTGRVGESDHTFDAGYHVAPAAVDTTTSTVVVQPSTTTTTTTPPGLASTTTVPLDVSPTTSTTPPGPASTTTLPGVPPADPPSPTGGDVADRPGAPTSPTRLAITGTSSWSLVFGGLVSLALGLQLVWFDRRQVARAERSARP